VIRLAPGLIASFVLLFGAHAAVAQQAPPLRIVVLSGEESVNVIQQKTAVAPLIEVRDRNNNPVAGAMVKFAIQGGKSAAFQGGATTMSVATNAAGQAVATGLTPLTTGAVNISVEAAFQGQVVTAAITQVNVMTAAEAAAAAGATGAGSGGGAAGAGGGAAGGAGGGISGTTIGIVSGVAAAGAVGAVAGAKVLGGGDKYVGTFSLTGTYNFANCAHTDVYTGALSIELKQQSAESISGQGEIQDGALSVSASTCSGVAVGRMGDGKWGMPDGPVAGTASSMTFTSQDNVPSSDGGGVTIDRTFKFLGALSGATITGQIDMIWIASGPNFPRVPMRTSITLQKQ